MSITVVKKLRMLDLPRMEKSVAIAMAEELREAHPQTGTWVGATRVSAKCSISVRSVYGAIANLKEKQIMKRIGYHVGSSAKMPIYTFHPENGQLLSFFRKGEPAIPACSTDENSRENLQSTTGEPAIGAENLQSTTGEPAIHAGEKGLRKGIDKEKRKTGPPSGSKERGQELLIWLAGQKLNLETPQQKTILAVAEIYSSSVLRRACENILSTLTIGNSFDRCEKKITDGLQLACIAVQREDRKTEQTDELLRVSTENEVKKAAEQTLRALAAAESEADLIEERLGD